MCVCVCVCEDEDTSQAVILHEDKKYFPDAEEVCACVCVRERERMRTPLKQ